MSEKNGGDLPTKAILGDREAMLRVILDRLEGASNRELKLVFWYVLKHCK